MALVDQPLCLRGGDSTDGRLPFGAENGSRVYGTQHQNPDFVRLAECFGMKAWRIEAAEGVDSALDAMLGQPGPTLLEVVTDPEDIPPTNLEAAMRMSN